MPQVSVVIPTYCEAENIPLIVPQIDEALSSHEIPAEIIIVDDNSPDETVDVCRELTGSYDLRLITRTNERGLSSAVIAGMRAAAGDVLVVMDADLSHPPAVLPELVSKIIDGDADFVIGSRYVPGGTTTEDWGFFRWANSKVATSLAWALTSVKDPLSGYFALTKAAFDEVESQLDPIGYKIGLELIAKCKFQRVVEIPIYFNNRIHGESKLNLKEQLNYLRHLGRLYRYRFRGPRRPNPATSVCKT